MYSNSEKDLAMNDDYKHANSHTRLECAYSSHFLGSKASTLFPFLSACIVANLSTLPTLIKHAFLCHLELFKLNPGSLQEHSLHYKQNYSCSEAMFCLRPQYPLHPLLNCMSQNYLPSGITSRVSLPSVEQSPCTAFKQEDLQVHPHRYEEDAGSTKTL